MITLTVVFCRLSYNDFLTNRVRRRKKIEWNNCCLYSWFRAHWDVCTVPFTVLSPSRARAARTLKELASSKRVFSKKTQSRILFLICSCWFYLQFKIRLASVTVSRTYCSKKCYNWPDNYTRPLLSCSLSTQHTAARYETGGACSTGELGHMLRAVSSVIQVTKVLSLETEDTIREHFKTKILFKVSIFISSTCEIK